MKISGFTIVRNAILYDFPIKESIRSILELVDEFVIVVGESEDETEKLIDSLNSPKIKIIKTVWDLEKFKSSKGSLFAYQTDIALKACTGDWCFYLQADEVVHEDSLPHIRQVCEKYLLQTEIEGFLFRYIHFYGDYDHYIKATHFAYPYEIRMVRNSENIHSWGDAQSFKYIKNFDGLDYYQTKDSRKLNCILLNASIFHYGWCRNPNVMKKKQNTQRLIHTGAVSYTQTEESYVYGGMSHMPLFKGSHPAVMRERILEMNWPHLLREKPEEGSEYHKKIFSPKYRLIHFLERLLISGKRFGGFKNYKIKGRF